MTRIVLAHSGGFDTLAAIPWLGGTRSAEVVTVTIDLGQDCDLADVRERALAAGARRAHVVDARLDLIRDYALPSLQAGALYAGGCPFTSALGLAVVARTVVDVARMEGALAIAHGAAGLDAQRIERAVRELDPALELVAVNELRDGSGVDAGAASRARNGSLPGSAFVPADRAANAWGRSIVVAAGSAPPSGFRLTRAPRECPEQPAVVEIAFERGVPVSVNGIEMPLLELIESLETIAGAHGIGRFEISAAGASAVATICEAPAAAVLHLAHRALERRIVPAEISAVLTAASRAYGDVVEQGGWFSPTRQYLAALIAAVQAELNGLVRLELFKGECVQALVQTKDGHGEVSPTLVLHPAS
jgi:argininosuccinate synthase